MVFDYEAAWADLLLVLGEKPQWGTRQIHEEMTRILGRRRFNESGLAEMIRLYGVQMDSPSRASAASPPTGSSGGAMLVDAHPPSHTEVDVHEHDHRNAA
jgi:hypothetical protein